MMEKKRGEVGGGGATAEKDGRLKRKKRGGRE